MTLRDDPRTYKKPVEEVADAIRPMIVSKWVARPEAVAAAAIAKLRSLGFISDLGIEAIRAEEAGK